MNYVEEINCEPTVGGVYFGVAARIGLSASLNIVSGSLMMLFLQTNIGPFVSFRQNSAMNVG